VRAILQDKSPSMQDPPFWRVHQCHVAAELPISQAIALLLALCCKGRKKPFTIKKSVFEWMINPPKEWDSQTFSSITTT
jgi:hypothetical protein